MLMAAVALGLGLAGCGKDGQRAAAYAVWALAATVQVIDAIEKAEEDRPRCCRVCEPWERACGDECIPFEDSCYEPRGCACNYSGDPTGPEGSTVIWH